MRTKIVSTLVLTAALGLGGGAATASAVAPEPDRTATTATATAQTPRNPSCGKTKLCAFDDKDRRCEWSGDSWDWGDQCGRNGDGKDGFSNRAVWIHNSGTGAYSYVKVFDAAGGGSTWTCIPPGTGLDLPYSHWEHGKDKLKPMLRDISAHVWVKKC